MRSVAPVAVAAITGVILWKLLVTLFVPFLGVVLGLLVTVAKFGLVVVVGYFIYSMIRKRREEAEA